MMLKKHKGFTLIELVVTVTIVSILALGIVPLAKVTIQREKEKELRADLRNIREAIDSWKRAYDEGRIRKSLKQSGYPPSLHALVEGVQDEKDDKKRKIRFLRNIPADPLNKNENLTAEESWGLRSYDSEAEDPHPGDDVYDVYSLSTHKGLNGRPYNTW